MTPRFPTLTRFLHYLGLGLCICGIIGLLSSTMNPKLVDNQWIVAYFGIIIAIGALFMFISWYFTEK